MEDILDVYQRPYDPQRPVVGIDEQPEQLFKETRQPLPAGPGQPDRVDYEYERNGTANIFMIAEIELSALTRQCLDRRIPDIPTLYREVKAWEKRRNDQQKGVDWQFTTKGARIKLKRLYQVIQT